jgi:excisionase family DNA binding protein
VSNEAGGDDIDGAGAETADVAAADVDLITLTAAAERLGVHYMTAYRYVRTGRLAGVREGNEWRVRTDDVDALLAPPAPDEPRGRRRRTDYRARLEDRLLAGDEGGAWELIERALTSSMEPADVYHDVLAPAMRSIGDRWAAGELTVADEHQASAITHRLIGRMGPRFVKRGRRRGTVILGSAPGDHHALPTAFLADLLRDRSFTVIDLGANTPVESFLDAVAHTPDVVAVGVCLTVPELAEAVTEVVEALHRAGDAPVVLGGAAIEDGPHAATLGADGWAPDGRAAVELFLDLAAR